MEQYKQLDVIPMGICVIDEQTRVIMWNDSLVKWTGITKSDAAGMKLSEKFPNLKDSLFHDRLATLFVDHNPIVHSASVHKFFLPITVMHGTQPDYMEQDTVIRYLSSEPQRAMICIQDVSKTYQQLAKLKTEVRDRKATQSKLQHSNDILQKITDFQTRIIRHVNHSNFYDELLNSMMDIVSSHSGMVIKTTYKPCVYLVQPNETNDKVEKSNNHPCSEADCYHFSIRACSDRNASNDIGSCEIAQSYNEESDSVSSFIRKNFFTFTIKQGEYDPEIDLAPVIFENKFRNYVVLPITNGNELIALVVLAVENITSEKNTLGLLTPVLTTIGQLLRARRAEIQNEQALVELRQNAQRLESARKEAELATKSKSEFLANMSHEIRTPMTAILGFTEVLMENNLTPEESKSTVEIIHKNGEHLLSLINDILDISKIEAGKMTMEKIQFSPVNEARQVLEMMRSRADAKNLRLEMEVISPLPSLVISDPTRFRQVIVNLIGNAIKFTHQGFIRLVMSVKFPPSINASPQIRLSIQDSGIGIEETKLKKIFDSFSQADSSTTREYGGTGLGLSISKKICQLLGGDLTVTSQQGKGSTFTATFQLDQLAVDELLNQNKTDNEANRKLADQVKQGHGLSGTHAPLQYNIRVLVVDDAIDNRRLVDFILKKIGIKADFAEHGLQAISMYLDAVRTENPYHLIFMDMHMPVMDGLTATGKLREEGYTGKIVALTANAMPQDRHKCIEAGCDDFLTKPINRKKMEELINQYQHEFTGTSNSLMKHS